MHEVNGKKTLSMTNCTKIENENRGQSYMRKLRHRPLEMPDLNGLGCLIEGKPKFGVETS